MPTRVPMTSPNPLGSVSAGKKRCRARLTTPSRPHNGPTTPLPTSAAPGTPFEIRWPLISFLRRAKYDESNIRLASQTSDPFIHQLVLVHLEELEEHFSTVRELRTRVSEKTEGPDLELEAIFELRSQFFRSVLRTTEITRTRLNSTTASLRACILESLANVNRQLQDLIDQGYGIAQPTKISSHALPDGSSSPDKKAQRSDISRSPTFGRDEYALVNQDNETDSESAQLSLCTRTPSKPLKAKTTFIGGTPSRHVPDTPGSSKASSAPIDGNTPLDKVKAKAVRFQRVKTFKDICTRKEEAGCRLQTPLRLSVQDAIGKMHHASKRLSMITEVEEEPSARGRKRKMGGDSADQEEEESIQSATKKKRVGGDYRNSTARQSVTTVDTTCTRPGRYSQETTATSVGRGRVSTLTENSEDRGGSTPEASAEDTVKRKSDIKVKKTIAAGNLLGTKVAPANRKKYTSRVAVNAKTRRTRERKTVREALHDSSANINEDGAPAPEISKNKSRWTRKADAIRNFQDQKFVAKTRMSMREILDSYRVEQLDESAPSDVAASQPRRAASDVPPDDSDIEEAVKEVGVAVGQSKSNGGLKYGKSHLIRQLRLIFGLQSFRVGQLESITHLLAATVYGENNKPADATPLTGDRKSRVPALLVSLPTGGGKSLIYQLSGYNLARYKHELTVVICPTIPLLDDQLNKMPTQVEGKRILSTAKLHGSIPFEEVRRINIGLSRGVIDILFTTPEQLITDRLQYYLKGGRSIGLVCIDEAHCLSEWGHSFRPAYQRIVKIAIQRLRIRRLLLTTATASESTLKSIRRIIDEDGQIELQIKRYGNYQNIEGSPNSTSCVIRPDLKKTVSLLSVGEGELNLNATRGLDELLNILKNSDWKNTRGVILVYCWMKWIAERACQRIKEEYPNEICLYYHSGMDEEEKQRVTSSLMKGKCRYLVATQALGIGVDSPHVVRVAHLNIPSTLEQYVQEIGRCNRTRQLESAVCHTIVDNNDYRLRYQQISSSLIDRIAVATSMKQLLLSEVPIPNLKSTRRNGKRSQDEDMKSTPPIFLDLFTVQTNCMAGHGSSGALGNNNSTYGLHKSIKQLSPDRRIIFTTILPNEEEHVPIIRGRIRPAIRDNFTATSSGSEKMSLSPVCGRVVPFELRLVMVTLAELGRMFNVRGEDELQVILTMLQELSERTGTIELSSEQLGATMEESPVEPTLSENNATRQVKKKRARKVETRTFFEDEEVKGLARSWTFVLRWWKERLAKPVPEGEDMEKNATIPVTETEQKDTSSVDQSQVVEGSGETTTASDPALEGVEENKSAGPSTEGINCVVEPSSEDTQRAEKKIDSSDPEVKGSVTVEDTDSSTEGEIIWPESPQMLHVYHVNSEGVEIRCFGEPLEEIAKINPLVKFLMSYWQKSGSGVYRIYWYDIMHLQHGEGGVATIYGSLIVNIDLVDQMLRDIAGDLHISLKPITGSGSHSNSKYVYMRLLHTDRGASSGMGTKLLRSMTDTVISTMERNNRIQLNRLDALMTAMLVRKYHSEEKMDEFIEDYFVNDEVDESGDRAKIWSHYKERYGIDPAKLLDDNNFHKKLGAVECSRLRYDVEQLVKYMKENGGNEIQLIVNDVGTVPKSEVKIITPMTVARILTGMASYQYNQQNSTHLPGWRVYNSTCFTMVKDFCLKTMRNL